MATRPPNDRVGRDGDRGLLRLAKRGGTAGVGVLGVSIGPLSKQAGTLPELLTLLSSTIWLLLMIRLLLHVGPCRHWARRPSNRQKVLNAKPEERQRYIDYSVNLNRVVVIEAGQLGIWGAIEYLNWLEPYAWVQTVLCAALWVTVPMVAAYNVTFASRLDLCRGSDVVLTWPMVRRWKRAIEPADEIPGHDAFQNFVENPGDSNKVSRLVKVTAMMLTVVMGAAVPQAVAELGAALNELDHHHVTGARHPGTSSHHHAESASGPYTAQCPGGPIPGAGAPRGAAREFHDLWLGGPYSDGAGAAQAGCARRAHREVHHATVYTVRGFCGAELRSLAVKAGTTGAVLLYQQAARFASTLAAKGQLYSASKRLPIGAGDAYLINDTKGSSVLYRSQQSEGKIPRLLIKKNGPACARFRASNAPYMVMPPPVVDWWVTEMGTKHAWLQPVWTRHPSRHAFDFTLDGKPLAHFECRIATICTLRLGTERYAVTSRWTTTPTALLRYAPRPP